MWKGEQNMKEKFMTPEMELVTFAAADVIATSDFLGLEDEFGNENV